MWGKAVSTGWGSSLDDRIDLHIFHFSCVGELHLFSMLSDIPCSSCLGPGDSQSKSVLEFIVIHGSILNLNHLLCKLIKIGSN